jgi:hypothetical protein
MQGAKSFRKQIVDRYVESIFNCQEARQDHSALPFLFISLSWCQATVIRYWECLDGMAQDYMDMMRDAQQGK